MWAKYAQHRHAIMLQSTGLQYVQVQIADQQTKVASCNKVTTVMSDKPGLFTVVTLDARGESWVESMTSYLNDYTREFGLPELSRVTLLQ